ncbi:MAG: 3-phosphoshikimate 1-carboxyvinyltransferase [Bacteroidales bacterium]|nr:3-phosphoshikimate 1-carboxyvinyltransferase [Bacteroidales bacterium]
MKLTAKRSKLSGEILIPASKSHTIRAVAIAAMARGKSVLRNPLESADARSAFRAASEFGARISVAENKWIIDGVGGEINKVASFVDVANSGTSLRIFSALASLASHDITFDGDASIRSRPMDPLLNALRDLGVRVKSLHGKCPFTITGPMQGGVTTVNGISSQFLTALLFACPLSEGTTELQVVNLHEKPYVEITLDWLRSQGIQFEQKGLDWFRIPGNQEYKAFDRQIPADFSTATFALCAAAITQSEVFIKGLDFSDHQGDKKVFGFLENMGVELTHLDNGVLVKGRPLKGIDIDMNDTPDALPALAVTACFADGETRLYNVAQARLKECDRISAMRTELTKMGADVEEFEDGLLIRKSKLTGSAVHGYDDHRMVMALALAGMAAEGETEVDTAEAVKVTYPEFVKDFVAMGGRLKEKN